MLIEGSSSVLMQKISLCYKWRAVNMPNCQCQTWVIVFPEVVGCSAVSGNNVQKRLWARLKVIKAFSLQQILSKPGLIHFSILQVCLSQKMCCSLYHCEKCSPICCSPISPALCSALPQGIEESSEDSMSGSLSRIKTLICEGSTQNTKCPSEYKHITAGAWEWEMSSQWRAGEDNTWPEVKQLWNRAILIMSLTLSQSWMRDTVHCVETGKNWHLPLMKW